MGAAFVQSLGSGGGTGSVAITVGANTTVGNMVSVGARGTSGNTISGVSDTRGNTWTVDQQTSTGATAGLVSCIVAAGKQILAGDTITVTFTGSTNCQANATEYSGVAVTAGAATVDQVAQNHVSAASITVATTADSAAGDLVLTCAGGSVNNAALTLTAADPDSGGTWTDLAYTGADAGYQIGAGIPSLYSASWAETSATNMSAVIVTYTAASGGSVSGPLAITLPAPAAALAGSVTPAGPLTVTLPAPQTALAAKVLVSGPLNITLPAPAASLAGSFTPPRISGTLTITLPPPATSFAASPGRELLLSLAGAAGTDDYGNKFPQGIGIYAAGQVLSYSGNPAAGNLIASIAAATGTDAYSNPVRQGFTSYANAGLSQMELASFQLAARIVGTTVEDALFYLDGTDGTSWVISSGGLAAGDHATMVLQSGNGTAGAGRIMIYSTSPMISQNPATGVAETWHTFGTPAAGWSISGRARYRLMPDNTVMIDINNLTLPSTKPSDGSQVWSSTTGLLPEWRPQNNYRIVCYDIGGQGTETAALEFTSTGAINVYGVGGTSITRMDVLARIPLD